MPLWTILFPLLSIGLVGLGFVLPVGALLIAAAVPALCGSVLASVHHAEVVARGQVGPHAHFERGAFRLGRDVLDDAKVAGEIGAHTLGNTGRVRNLDDLDRARPDRLDDARRRSRQVGAGA